MPPKIAIKKQGSLTSLGYHSKDPMQKRHVALDKAVDKYGEGTVAKKLNAISVLNKNKPIGKTFLKDLGYVTSK